MQERGKFTIFCLLMVSLLLPTVNLTAQPVQPNSGDGSIVDRLFIDKQGIPYLRATNGSRGRYLRVSKNLVELEIHKEGLVGTVKIERRISRSDLVEAGEILVEFISTSGNHLTFGTIASADGKVETLVKFNGDQLRVDPRSYVVNGENRPQVSQQVDSMLAGAAEDPGLQKLTREALPYLTRTSLLKVLPAALSEHQYVSDCAVEATDCLVSLVAYGISMSALYSSCGFTLGAGCIAALLAHPVMSGAVVIYCGRALQSCGITQ